MIFVTRPVSLAFLLATLGFLALPLVRRRGRARAAPPPVPGSPT
jgi:hypothetical protein